MSQDPVIVYGVMYTRFVGACDQHRIRGFALAPDGKADLSREVYAGKWKSKAAALAELASIADPSEALVPDDGDAKIDVQRYIPPTDEQLAASLAPMDPEAVKRLLATPLYSKRQRYPQVPTTGTLTPGEVVRAFNKHGVGIRQQEPMQVESLDDWANRVAEQALGPDSARIAVTPRANEPLRVEIDEEQAAVVSQRLAPESPADKDRRAFLEYVASGGRLLDMDKMASAAFRFVYSDGYGWPRSSCATTLPDMVPAAVLARRPPAHIPTPTDLDDHLIPDAEPTGSIVRR